MNLLFAINRKFTDLLLCCMRSIVKNGGAEHYDAYVLHSDLDSDEQERLRLEAFGPIELHFVKIDESIFDGFPESPRYPRQIYYRLASPLFLPKELDRILYLDVDLIVINSLSELYNTDFEGNYYIACSHVREFLTKFNQVRLGVEEDVPYINTGVMLMNLPLLRSNLSIEQIKDTAKKKMRSFMLPDQDLLTIMHGEHIKLTDPMRYNLSDRILNLYNALPQNESIDLDWIRKNGVIIHYCGKNKPWNENYTGILDVFYNEIAGDPAMDPAAEE
ncbi:MAG: glycosyltransferase family 8 protein [Oscillospiraceae bacterium]